MLLSILHSFQCQIHQSCSRKEPEGLLAALRWNHNTSAPVAPAAIFAQPSSERRVQMCLMWGPALCQGPWVSSACLLLCCCAYLSHFCCIFSQPVSRLCLLEMFQRVVACTIQHAPSESQLSNTPKRARPMPERLTVASRGRKHTSLKTVTLQNFSLSDCVSSLNDKKRLSPLKPGSVFLTIAGQTRCDSTGRQVNVVRNRGKVK